MSDLVHIKHPDLPDSRPAVATREAFDQLWSRKGFQIVNEDGSPVQEPAELKGKALDEALTSAGLSTSGSADEKRERLAAHQAGTPVDGLEG